MADAKNWNKANNEGGTSKGSSMSGGNPHGGTGSGTPASGTPSTISELASEGREKIQGAVQAAGEGIGHAAEKVQRWAEDAYGASAEGVGRAADRVQHWASDAYDASADQMRDIGQEITSFVKRNPMPALLIGFGVGLLLGRASRA